MKSELTDAGNGKKIRRRGTTVVIVVGVSIGLALSALVARHLYIQETRQIDDEFAVDLGRRVDALQRSIDVHLESLAALRSFHDASGNVERHMFETYASQAILRQPAIQVLKWIPRVAERDRQRFEEEARLDGHEAFQFTEQLEPDRMVRAESREEYFPVFFVEPLAGNEMAFGFDLGSEATRKITLDSARDGGDMEATARIQLVRETAGQYGVLVVGPVYRGRPVSVAERRENLTGFVLGVFRIGEIVERAMGITLDEDGEIDLRLVDLSAMPEEQTLYSNDSATASPFADPPKFERRLKRIPGRRWVVHASPTASYVKRRHGVQPILALAIGVLFTIIGMGYLRTGIDKGRAVRDLVEKRTRDLTETTLRLEQQKGILQSVLDHLGDGVAVADETGKLTMFNPAAEEILGMGITDSGPAQWSETYGLFQPDTEELIPTADLPLTRAIAGEECRNVEILVRNPNRRGDVYILVTATPLRGREGDLRGGVAIIHDITDKKWADAVLRDSEARFRTIVEATSSALLILSPDRRIQEFNPQAEQMFGINRAEALGRDFLEVCVPESRRGELAGELSRATAGEGIRNFEATIHSANGDEQILFWSVSRMSGTDGGTPVIVATGLDITQQRHAAEVRRARELAAHLQSAREKERAHLAREIHDELGQSLTGLKFAIASLERRTGKGGADLKQRLGEIAKMADETIRSVRRLASALRPQLLDEFGFVEAIRWHVREFAGRTGLVYNLELPEDEIDWSPEQSTAMFRLVQESLTNVAKHAEAKNVFVSIVRDGGRVILEIRDDGRGITRDQASNSRNFGLRGMQERARMFGGRLEITGKAGRGTTVTAHMPI